MNRGFALCLTILPLYCVTGITPCTECEKTKGQYSNSVKNFFDYVAKWIDARF